MFTTSSSGSARLRHQYVRADSGLGTCCLSRRIRPLFLSPDVRPRITAPVVLEGRSRAQVRDQGETEKDGLAGYGQRTQATGLQNMKKLILLFFLLLVFAGGAAGFWYAWDVPVMLGWKEAPAVEEHHEPEPEVLFTTLGRLTIPVFRGHKVHRQVEMVVSLGVHLDEAHELVEAQKSRLHDLVLREMTSYINLQFDESNAMNVADVKKRIMIVANAYLGKITFGDGYLAPGSDREAQKVIKMVTVDQLFLAE